MHRRAPCGALNSAHSCRQLAAEWYAALVAAIGLAGRPSSGLSAPHSLSAQLKPAALDRQALWACAWAFQLEP